MYTPCGKAHKDDPSPLLIASADFYLEWPETVLARTVEWGFIESQAGRWYICHFRNGWLALPPLIVSA